jgi:hypothetical protein
MRKAACGFAPRPRDHFVLFRDGAVAMVPPSQSATTPVEELPEVIPVLGGTVRGVLVGIAAGLIGVFAIAWRLDPYQPDGTPRRMETHRQLGLPPCTFYALTRLPCPSCGMTTSFALLVRGDVVNSVRANVAGTVLAVFCLLLIPWCLASAWKGHSVFVRSAQVTFVVVILAFFALMVVRWVLVLGLAWLRGEMPQVSGP